MKYYILPFKNIFNYKDQSTIKEFWFFIFINLFVTTLLMLLIKILGLSIYIQKIYDTIFFFAFISIGFRRLRNAGLSGWLFLIPIINLILAAFPEKKK